MPNPIIKGYSETALTIAVSDYLHGNIHHGRNIIKIGVPFPDLLFTFVANEGRSEADGAKFKRMGVMRGISDFVFWWKTADGTFGAGGIELKTEIGKQSPYQRNFEGRMKTLGGKYSVCRTVAQVRDTLISWGLECKNPNCIEPKASMEVRLAAARAYSAKPIENLNTTTPLPSKFRLRDIAF